MSADPRPPVTSWAGKPPEQRREERRRRLLEAGLDAFGTEGYVASSINRICKAARVTERDLYREFGGKPGLLVAVYDAVISDVHAAVADALDDPADPSLDGRVRAAIDAFTASLTADPRVARLNFLEVVGADPQVEVHRREVVRGFGHIVDTQWRALVDAGQLDRLPAPGLPMALVGAAQELLVDWVSAPGARSRADVVDEVVRVFVAVMRHA
ncbi:TetR/AcrR family transcriptional regulator [Nitriliruptoraceae bacterium ZYF776]|nr:TetR/AcrR family transcriptional regulator [Profundirhabdus halotolerans]